MTTQPLETALQNYLDKLEALKRISQCTSTWNGDRAEPGYLGTRCDVTEGHPPGTAQDGRPDGGHRARIPGTHVVVTW